MTRPTTKNSLLLRRVTLSRIFDNSRHDPKLQGDVIRKIRDIDVALEAMEGEGQWRGRETVTDEQKKFCNQVAQWMERIREFPGGTTFLVDLFIAICARQNLEIVDRSDPSISLRREVTQELYDALWTARELRKAGYTMATAGKLGLADLYAAHGSPGLQRFLDVATNNALHNAGLSGISLSPVHNAVN